MSDCADSLIDWEEELKNDEWCMVKHEDEPEEKSTELHLSDPAHEMLSRLLRRVQKYGYGKALPWCRALHSVLPDGLHCGLTPEDVLDAVIVAVSEANWGPVCACCAVDKLLYAADFDPTIYGCAHKHEDASPDPDYPAVSSVRRVATAMAAPNPTRYAAARQRAAYPYAYGYSSGSDSDSSRASPSPSGYASSSSDASSSSSSDSGRVSKTKRAARARASPYARPAAAPRSRSVEALATRVAAVDLAADSDVDAVTGQLKHVAIADNGYYFYSPPAAGYNYCPQPKQSAVRTSSWPCTMAEYYKTNRL